MEKNNALQHFLPYGEALDKFYEIDESRRGVMMFFYAVKVMLLSNDMYDYKEHRIKFSTKEETALWSKTNPLFDPRLEDVLDKAFRLLATYVLGEKNHKTMWELDKMMLPLITNVPGTDDKSGATHLGFMVIEAYELILNSERFRDELLNKAFYQKGKKKGSAEKAVTTTLIALKDRLSLKLTEGTIDYRKRGWLLARNLLRLVIKKPLITWDAYAVMPFMDMLRVKQSILKK